MEIQISYKCEKCNTKNLIILDKEDYPDEWPDGLGMGCQYDRCNDIEGFYLGFECKECKHQQYVNLMW